MMESHIGPFGEGQLFYRVTRPADEKGVILLVHGALCDSRIFYRQFHALGREYRLIAPDLPGHGRSFFSSPPTPEDCISAVDRVMELENVSGAVILGHSMGGPVALLLAGRQPGRIRAMVLVSTAAHISLDKSLRDILTPGGDPLDIMSLVFSGRRARIAASFIDTDDPAIRSRLANDISLCDRMDASGVCPSVSYPVLCVASKGDRLIPAAGTDALSRNIPGSRIHLFDGTSHVPFLENPGEFNDILFEFLRYLQ